MAETWKWVGHQPVVRDEGVARIRIERELEEEDEQVDHDQQHRDHRLGVARLCVA